MSRWDYLRMVMRSIRRSEVSSHEYATQIRMESLTNREHW